jgi:hypothetical protein
VKVNSMSGEMLARDFLALAVSRGFPLRHPHLHVASLHHFSGLVENLFCSDAFVLLPPSFLCATACMTLHQCHGEHKTLSRQLSPELPQCFHP